MKTSFSNPRVITAVAATALVLSWTLTAGAAATSTKHATVKPAAPNFCSNFATSAQKNQAQLATRVSTFMAQFKAHEAKLVANRTTADNTIDQKRTGWDTERTAVYAKLTAKATTDAQKQAVTTFKASMEAAVTARESAVDQARIAFRAGVDQLLAKRAAAMNTVLTGYQTSLQTAVNQAQAACDSKTEPATVRTQYETALKEIRTDRLSHELTSDKVGDDVKKLAEIRNAAIQQALTNFQTTQRNALNTLKAAFGEKPITTNVVTSTSTTPASTTTAATSTTSR